MSHRLTIALLLLALSGCATFYTPRTPLPIAEVVNLGKSGAPSATVIQRIRDSGTSYALRGSDFAKLKTLGVPDPVLDFLQQSLVNDLDFLTRYWVLGESLGACSFCFPQPVDVDKLESGYGTVASLPPGYYQPGKPPGAPDWVPATLNRPTAGRLNIADLEQMVKSGTPDAEIIQRLQNSRLDHVIGVGGTFSIRTQPAAGLNGSELARLHTEGASDAVLDTLQAQFLAQFIEAERLRYQNWGKGPGAMP